MEPRLPSKTWSSLHAYSYARIRFQVPETVCPDYRRLYRLLLGDVFIPSQSPFVLSVQLSERKDFSVLPITS